MYSINYSALVANFEDNKSNNKKRKFDKEDKMVSNKNYNFKTNGRGFVEADKKDRKKQGKTTRARRTR